MSGQHVAEFGRTRSRREILRRDDVQFELVVVPGHDPTMSCSCYFDVTEVKALRQEFVDAGASPGAIEVQEHSGQRFHLLFLREATRIISPPPFPSFAWRNHIDQRIFCYSQQRDEA